MSVTIGLFGTCGKSKWREPFIEKFNEREISYYNPQKDNWDPNDAVDEAYHLANDDIILFPVTGETYAFGSLAESGFSIIQALKNTNRDIIIMIDMNVNMDEQLMSMNESITHEIQKKDSLRARKLVLEHIKKNKHPNVYLVENLENMLNLCLYLHSLHVLKEGTKRFTIND